MFISSAPVWAHLLSTYPHVLCNISEDSGLYEVALRPVPSPATR